MTAAEFLKLADAGYTRIPVLAEASADLYTPLAVYMMLAGGPYSYLLESVVGGERFGRYSFIGLACAERIEARGRTLRRLLRDARGADVCLESLEDADPFEYARAWLGRQRVAPAPAALRFGGGLVGYFGYESVRHIEKNALKGEKADALGTPDMLLLVSDELAVVDNVLGKLYLVVYADPRQPDALRAAKERLERLRARLARPLPEDKVLLHLKDSFSTDKFECSFTEPAFLEAVRRCKEYILAGDVMQVQVSQRTSREFDAPPLSLYRALRGLNPSPYMFYFDFADHHVVGVLVRLAGDTVTLRPIAGTRPRGATPEEDAARAAELLADPKERAEHVMLIDLGRNDVGRVAAPGSVKVTEQMVVERYSHVMHIVSNVEGRIAPGLGALDVLKASFPAGTVTGAPKVRAMQIIDELEPVKRGLYSGAVGYLGFNGDMDLAIAIRTALVKDGRLHVQAAAGIVADSEPRSEWQETQHKALALLKAAALCAPGGATEAR